MKKRQRQWEIRRQLSEQSDGTGRWDQSYQLLLTWMSKPAPPICSSAIALKEPRQEVNNESSSLCTSVNPKPGQCPND